MLQIHFTRITISHLIFDKSVVSYKKTEFQTYAEEFLAASKAKAALRTDFLKRFSKSLELLRVP